MIWNLLFTLICLWRWRNVVGGLCGEGFFNENIVVVEEEREPEKKEKEEKENSAKQLTFN